MHIPLCLERLKEDEKSNQVWLWKGGNVHVGACVDRTLYEHSSSSLAGALEDPVGRTPDTPCKPRTTWLRNIDALRSEFSSVLEAIQ